MTTRTTGRWAGVTALAFLAGAVGVLAGQPTALLLGVVGVAYAAYARAGSAPEPAVSVERSVGTEEPGPGEEVAVTVEVRNDGEALLPDLRVVDGVPEALAVVDGSPRLATALRPGKRATLTYAVSAARGRHEFGPATVLARDASGATERETTVEAEPGTPLRCVPELTSLGDAVPLRKQTVGYTGRVTTDTGGTGVEFHATRAYRSGDPLSRVDWRRLARTGELSTVEFREEEAATAVLVVDSREPAYVTGPGDVPALEHGVAAAGQVAAALLDSGDRVGLAALGPTWTWLRPGLGRVHRRRLRRTLALDPAFPPTPGEGRFLPGLALRRLRKHLPADAQVVLFSPAVEGYLPIAARRLEAHGHAVTLVSPDVTGGDSPGAKLVSLERDRRLRSVRGSGIRALDWDPERPLAAAVAEARRRWSG